MNSIIIEDEKVAAERLKELVLKYDPGIEIETVLQSVKSSVKWINSNVQPDLIFMDIQLSDGLSFEIFEQTSVKSPVIFTTAYEEYTLKAFKVNSIDYLLKPVDYDELKRALDKFRNSPFNKKLFRYSQDIFEKVLYSLTKEFKNKFVIKVGDHIRIVQSEEICCFYSIEKSTFLQTKLNRNYDIAHSLDQLEELIDPSKFFRINRQFIIAFDSITDIIHYSNSRLRLKIQNNDNKDFIVSREKVQQFKLWLEK